MTKDELALRGRERVLEFCAANEVAPPELAPPGEVTRAVNHYQSCGLYDTGTIYVSPARCAAPGRGGRAWSWPGYVVDRTPFGVYCHELGHYFDELLSGRRYQPTIMWKGNFSHSTRTVSGEPALTGYCPNSAEWFAEMFRLFVTNSDLLHHVRPATCSLMLDRLTPCETRPWRVVLRGAPARYFAAARNKIAAASRGS